MAKYENEDWFEGKVKFLKPEDLEKEVSETKKLINNMHQQILLLQKHLDQQVGKNIDACVKEAELEQHIQELLNEKEKRSNNIMINPQLFSKLINYVVTTSVDSEDNSLYDELLLVAAQQGFKFATPSSKKNNNDAQTTLAKKQPKKSESAKQKNADSSQNLRIYFNDHEIDPHELDDLEGLFKNMFNFFHR